MLGGGVFDLAPGQVTDDTQMAVALWDSLNSCQRFSARDVASRYVEWSKVAFDVGAQTSAALMLVDQGTGADEAGRLVWEASGRRAAGNGSLMRTAPIGVYFAGDSKKRRAASIRDSAITHFDPRCVLACAAMNSAIAYAAHREEATPSTVLSVARCELDTATVECISRWPELRAEFVSALGNLKDDLACATRNDPLLFGEDQPEALDMHATRGFVRVAFRLAFWALLHIPSFEAALLSVVNLGGDSDTNGAIAGALLGAFHGTEAIPAEWMDAVLRSRGSPHTRAVATRYHPKTFV